MDDADKYRALLIEIKRRTSVADAFISQKINALYEATTVESACLQVRKILELIAFGSLIANKKVFKAQHEKFSKYWNAETMIRDMERINPNFYPKPILQKPSNKLGIKMEWLERPNDYLTKDKFVKVYKKCGAVLHAENPYGSKINYDYYGENLIKWRNEIVNLLDAHSIRLLDDTNLYLFQMGSNDKNPSYTPFGLVYGVGT
ncbi:MAG: hypothetical protein Q8S94_01390 [Pseudohongiella sp.]|nr:hypothetical protein [Pseudohongiella sp.]